MRRFARLFAELDETTKMGEKTAAMVRYFADADPADAAWAIYFLRGDRPKRIIPVRRLASWAMDETGTSDWLFAECYDAVGDLAETISLLLPEATRLSDRSLRTWIEDVLLPLVGADATLQKNVVVEAWRELNGVERLVWNKLITGGFRVGVSHGLVVRALSRASGIEEAVIAHRLSGAWEPRADAFTRLVSTDTRDADVSRPYPFFLAYDLEGSPETLGEPAEWRTEWKWDGIRAQLIRRRARTFLWSRGEESVLEKFPEIDEAAAVLPDGTVLDGELLAWLDGKPLTFAKLQQRMGRKKLDSRILAQIPVVFVAYDLLECGGEDIRELPLMSRRERLEGLLATVRTGGRLILSPPVELTEWSELRKTYERSREFGTEGLMLKRLDSAYGVGRRRGPWWKWKVKPFTVDAVMVYAQAGHGRGASLHSDYTFAVWDDGELLPFAKVHSGLDDEEIRRLDTWIVRNTLEKFGPVRSVRAEQVFELGFEGIQASTRHKSGLAVRSARILRWRTDKKAPEADTLETLRGLMEVR